MLMIKYELTIKTWISTGIGLTGVCAIGKTQLALAGTLQVNIFYHICYDKLPKNVGIKRYFLYPERHTLNTQK